MTVKELIEVLKGYEQDSEVHVWSIIQSKFVILNQEDITENSKYKILFIDKN